MLRGRRKLDRHPKIQWLFTQYSEKMECSTVPRPGLLNHPSYNQEMYGIFQLTDYLYHKKK